MRQIDSFRIPYSESKSDVPYLHAPKLQGFEGFKLLQQVVFCLKVADELFRIKNPDGIARIIYLLRYPLNRQYVTGAPGNQRCPVKNQVFDALTQESFKKSVRVLEVLNHTGKQDNVHALLPETFVYAVEEFELTVLKMLLARIDEAFLFYHAPFKRLQSGQKIPPLLVRTPKGPAKIQHVEPAIVRKRDSLQPYHTVMRL